MKLTALALLSSVALCQAQGNTLTPLSVEAGQLQRIKSILAECAGVDTSAALPTFLVRSPSVFTDNTRRYKFEGQWISDTVFIDREYKSWSAEKFGWVIAHELLHHYLGGPPGATSHPPGKFIPCGLYETQKPGA